MNKVQVFCFAIVVLATHHAHATPLVKGSDAVEYENCKSLCNLCNCIGFYCGDECICECFNKSDESEWMNPIHTANSFQLSRFLLHSRYELCSRSTKQVWKFECAIRGTRPGTECKPIRSRLGVGRWQCSTEDQRSQTRLNIQHLSAKTFGETRFGIGNGWHWYGSIGQHQLFWIEHPMNRFFFGLIFS